MRKTLLAFTFASIFPSLILAKLPPDAQKVVNALPDKALTLELILARGAKSTESFKELVESEAALIPVSELQAESIFTTKFTASAEHSDNRNEPSSPFATDKSVATAYKLGASKYFSSGTAIELGFSHSDVNLEFPASSSIAPLSYYDSGLTLGLKQSLLKDSFGYSSRRNLKSAKKFTEAQTHRTEAALEQWTKNISDLFYTAWLSKQSLITAEQALKRRNQLLKTTKLKAKRGTAERPDLLQVESVRLLAITQRDRAAQELNNHWRTLILSLKLPSEWIQVDPRNVPIKLDNPIQRAQVQCKTFRQKGVPASESAVVRMTEALKEGFDLQAEAKKKEVLPDLSLVGSLGFNGVDNSSSDSLSEGSSTDNPAWAIGLNLTIPMSFDAEKSEYLQAYANQIRNTAAYNSAKDDLRIAWMNDCSNLDRLTKSNEQARIAFKKQTAREKLERKRFRLGRIPVFNFIQAGDDAADAERYYNQQQVLLRQSSWQVLRNSSQISDIMKDLGKKYDTNN